MSQGRARGQNLGHLKGFLYPATLKSAGYYVIPSIQKIVFECPSVCMSVRPSAYHLGAIFNQFSSHLL